MKKFWETEDRKTLKDFNVTTIFVEVTNVCNMHCKFCVSDHLKRKRDFMSFDTFKKVIDELAELELPQSVALNVLGEPLLHKEIFRFIDYCASKDVSLYLLTNGTLIRENIEELCKRSNIEALVLSLQTPTPKSYKLRGYDKLTFHQYMDGIFSAVQHVIRIGANEKMRVEIHLGNTIGIPFDDWEILTTSEDALEAIDWLCRELRGSGLDDSIPENIIELREWDYWGYKVLPNIFIRMKYFGTYGVPPGLLPDNMEIVERTTNGPCDTMMSRDYLSIFTDGTITSCCFDIEGELALGNINKRTIHRALSSRRREKILKDVSPYQLCRRCLGDIKVKPCQEQKESQ